MVDPYLFFLYVVALPCVFELLCIVGIYYCDVIVYCNSFMNLCCLGLCLAFQRLIKEPLKVPFKIKLLLFGPTSFENITLWKIMKKIKLCVCGAGKSHIYASRNLIVIDFIRNRLYIHMLSISFITYNRYPNIPL